MFAKIARRSSRLPIADSRRRASRRNKLAELAMPCSDLITPKIAYYKGLGLMRMGEEFTGMAISAFETSIKLDKSNHYTSRTKLHVDELYRRNDAAGR